MTGSVVTRDWEALEMTDMIGQHGHITVTGEVELTETGTTAELKERSPQGTNQKVLLLELVIHRQGGIHGHIAWFEKVTFKKNSSGHAYDEVDVFHGDAVVQRVKVEHPLTFAAPPMPSPGAKETPAKKTPAEKTPAKKAPAKKAPAEKAPAEKKPPKAAAAKKKAAKKAAKKPAKKVARKSAKKSAKKAAKKNSTKKRSAKKKSAKRKK
jgi:hypothetical protein